MARSSLLQPLVRRVKPWTLAVTLLAVGLLGYYALLGLRYWNGSQQAASLTQQTRQLSGAGNLPSEESQARELQAQEQRLARVLSFFAYPGKMEPAAVVAETAQETPVTLISVVLGDPQPKVKEGIVYQAQPMTIGLQGADSDILRFLDLLSQKMPATSVTNIRITVLETAPSAQVQLIFYMSPAPAPERTPQATPQKGRAP